MQIKKGVKPTQTEIKKIFNRARRILKHPGLDLLIAPSKESPGKLFVITPARIGNAVQRNTIRRKIKELYRRENLDQKGFDFVIFVKKVGTAMSSDQLKLVILSAINESNI